LSPTKSPVGAIESKFGDRWNLQRGSAFNRRALEEGFSDYGLTTADLNVEIYAVSNDIVSELVLRLLNRVDGL